MGLFSYSPSSGIWHHTAEKRGRPRPVPSCKAIRVNGEIIPHPIKSFRYEKILLLSAVLLLVCVGTPEEFQLQLPAVKQIKGWKSETTDQIHEKSPTILCHLKYPRAGEQDLDTAVSLQPAGVAGTPQFSLALGWQRVAAELGSPGRGRSDLPQGTSRRDLTSAAWGK